MSDEVVVDQEAGEEGAKAPSQEVLDEAFAQGWVPKEQWTGREDEWTDAETFVRRGREINPILRKTLKRKDAEIDALRRELTEMKGTVAEIVEHKAKIEKLAYERALKDLKAQKKAAMVDQDFERVAEVDEAIDQLRDAKPDDTTPKKKDDKKADAPTVDPRIAGWIERNPWYNDRPENADLVAYANGISNQMVQAALASGAQPDPDVILPQVALRVKKVFPDYFKGTPAMFDTGGEGKGESPSGKPTGKKGFSSLPADAKAQFERFYKSGYYPNMKKEDAQAQYFSDYE